MIGYEHLEDWSIGFQGASSLIIGIVCLFGFNWLGKKFGDFLKLKTNQPWQLLINTLIGVTVFQFINQILAISRLVYPKISFILLAILLVAGCAQIRIFLIYKNLSQIFLNKLHHKIDLVFVLEPVHCPFYFLKNL